MLRTNSKKAIENIRAYILDNFDVCNYSEYGYITEAIETNKRRDSYDSDLPRYDIFSMAAHAILDCFHAEKLKYDNRYQAGRVSRSDLFVDWCQGLPSILDCGYYYNRSALKDVQNILEQTNTEAAKYSERDAEKLLTALIWRELNKVAC